MQLSPLQLHIGSKQGSLESGDNSFFLFLLKLVVVEGTKGPLIVLVAVHCIKLDQFKTCTIDRLNTAFEFLAITRPRFESDMKYVVGFLFPY